MIPVVAVVKIPISQPHIQMVNISLAKTNGTK